MSPRGPVPVFNAALLSTVQYGSERGQKIYPTHELYKTKRQFGTYHFRVESFVVHFELSERIAYFLLANWGMVKSRLVRSCSEKKTKKQLTECS